MGKQLKTKQWKIINESKTFNNYNIKCINERLGDLLSGSEDWEATIKAANKGTYKHIGAESSKVFYIDLYKNLLTSQNNPFANGQYSGTFLYCQNGGSTYNKVLSDLAKESWDYLDLFASRISDQAPAYLAWKPDPFDKGTYFFLLPWRNLKGYAFSPFRLHRTGFEGSSSGTYHNNSNNFGMTGTTMVLKGTSDEHSQSSPNPSRNNLVIGPDFQPHSLVENRTLQLVALVVSGKNFLQREKAVSFISDT